MKRITAVAVMAFLFSQPAVAGGRSYIVWGFGANSCGTWTLDQQRGGSDALVDIAWAEGFITAMDYNVPKVDSGSRHADTNAMVAWVNTYCAAHPLDSISVATEAFSSALLTHR